MSVPQYDYQNNNPLFSENPSQYSNTDAALSRFMSHAAPNQRVDDLKLSVASAVLERKLKFEVEYEPPSEYWSALWSRPTHKNRSSSVKVQMQGSVLRVSKKLSPGGEKSKFFDRDWEASELVEVQTKNKIANKKAIHEFSRGSRRTLLDKLMSLVPDAWHTAKFLTLTYHDSVPPPKRAKDDLRAFYKRLVRYVKTKKRGAGYRPSWFWRMEIKERLSGELLGQPAPHFHIFLFGCPYIPRDMMLKWWHEITGDSTITQLDVKRLDNRRKGMNYVSKYVAKPMEADKDFGSASEAGAYLDISLYLAAMGRFWGFEGGQDIPYAVVKEVIYSPLDRSLLNFVSVLENLYPHLLSRWSFGFKIFEFGDEMERIKSIWFELNFPIADLEVF